MKTQKLYQEYQILKDQEPSSEIALESLVNIEKSIKDDLFELLELGEESGEMLKKNSVLLKMYSAGGKERAYVERLFLRMKTGENSNIDDLLQDLIDATQKILSVENPQQIIKELNILHEHIKSVILPPDYQPISTGNGDSERQEKKSPYNKFSLLISLLMKRGIYTDDLFSMTGDLRPEMMRDQTYIYIAIPRLNRTIFINNSYGEATYIYQGILPKDEAFVAGKQKLKSDFNSKKVNFSAEHIENRLSDISLLLFHDRENPSLEQLIGEKKTKNELKEQFGLKRKDRKSMNTIEDWEMEFNKHPEWKGKSTTWMKSEEGKEMGGISFYKAFNNWINKKLEHIEDEQEKKQARKELVDRIFPAQHKDWSFLKTIEDWESELAKYPEWEGKSTAWMVNGEGKKSGGGAFYRSFKNWIKKQVEEIINEKEKEIKRKELVEKIFPAKNKDWNNFKTIEDWESEFVKYPEWEGKSTSWMVSEEGKVNGGNAFYQAFSKWTNKKVEYIEDEEKKEIERKKLVEKIFPVKYQDWNNLKTIGDWESEFAKYPEWEGKSTTWIMIMEGKVNGGSAFYQAFNKWTNKKVEYIEDEEKKEIERKKLVEKIFPAKNNDWSSFKTIEDWEVEFEKHPEWHGKNTSWMDSKEGKENGGSAFYTAFYNRTKKQVEYIEDEEKKEIERKKLVEKIFPAKNNDWSSFKTIEDWEVEFIKHPDWKGKSTYWMESEEGKDSGGTAFYAAFSKWTHKQVEHIKDETEKKQARKKLVEQIFPKKK